MALPPSGRQVRLSAYGQEIVVVEVGGGLRSYQVDGHDIVDPYDESEMCSGGRGQLLAPWPNRLDGGCFEWRGRVLQTALTEVGAGNAIHGLVRWSNWSLPDATPQPWGPQTPPDTVTVTHRLHPQPGWPWTLDLRVTYRLVAGRGLEVRTSATNVSVEDCPIGLGWHPYLRAMAPHVDECRLRLPAASFYRADERGIPREKAAVDGTDMDFRNGQQIGPARLDVAFTDLIRDHDGRARVVLEGPAGGPVEVWMDSTYTHVMVFTGDSLSDPARRRRGVAIEPMTGAADLLNNGDGLRVLEPGAMLEAVWGIDPYGAAEEG